MAMTAKPCGRRRRALARSRRRPPRRSPRPQNRKAARLPVRATVRPRDRPAQRQAPDRGAGCAAGRPEGPPHLARAQARPPIRASCGKAPNDVVVQRAVRRGGTENAAGLGSIAACRASRLHFGIFGDSLPRFQQFSAHRKETSSALWSFASNEVRTGKCCVVANERHGPPRSSGLISRRRMRASRPRSAAPSRLRRRNRATGIFRRAFAKAELSFR